MSIIIDTNSPLQDMPNDVILEQLFSVMEEAGLTVEEVSEKTGIDMATLMSIFRGEFHPPMNEIIDILDVCGYDLKIEMIPEDQVAAARAENVEPALVL